ncbi:hypothetical protein AB838_20400 [Rhodobacteraceae bacterium (ex Bugula neritina AB1)]|nr:hypothetical protein AB838_20400 [Rhodobacteraceae bacterium (ex Bugula neritina AB1)]
MAPLLLPRLPTIALAAILAGAVWWVTNMFWERVQLRSDLEAAQSDLREARAELLQAAETARIHRAHLARAADRAREWDALSNDLEMMEGRDAPLSPLLSATAERLYGAGP